MLVENPSDALQVDAMNVISQLSIMDQEMSEISNEDLLNVAADIVSAFVSKDPVRAEDLPKLIETVCFSVSTLGQGQRSPQLLLFLLCRSRSQSRQTS